MLSDHTRCRSSGDAMPSKGAGKDIGVSVMSLQDGILGYVWWGYDHLTLRFPVSRCWCIVERHLEEEAPTYWLPYSTSSAVIAAAQLSSSGSPKLSA